MIWADCLNNIIHIDDFEDIKKAIGKGVFGNLNIYKYKDNNKLYVCKIWDLNQILKQEFFKEKDIL